MTEDNEIPIFESVAATPIPADFRRLISQYSAELWACLKQIADDGSILLLCHQDSTQEYFAGVVDEDGQIALMEIDGVKGVLDELASAVTPDQVLCVVLTDDHCGGLLLSRAGREMHVVKGGSA